MLQGIDWKLQLKERQSLISSPQSCQSCTGRPSLPWAELVPSLLEPRNSNIDKGEQAQFSVALKIGKLLNKIIVMT